MCAMRTLDEGEMVSFGEGIGVMTYDVDPEGIKVQKKWQRYKKLSVKHREVLQLVAEGKNYKQISALTGYSTPTVCIIVKSPAGKQYLKDIMDVVDARLIMMTVDSVNVIAEAMKDGTTDEKLKAARMHLETVGRIGSRRMEVQVTNSTGDHLEQLAERLLNLNTPKGKTYENHDNSHDNSQGTSEAELLPCETLPAAQDTGEV